MPASISNSMDRRKIISVFLYLSLALAAALLLLSYVHATSIGTNVTVSGNTTLGDTAASDALTVTARLASDLIPSTNDARNLGAYGNAYKNIFASSTAYLDFVSSTAITLVSSSTLTLTSSTTDSNTGVIYKGSDSFIHNFSHPTGNTAIPTGLNTFVGLQAGNFTMGSTATAIYHGSYNTGIGYKTLNANTTGAYNVGIGQGTLIANTTGGSNIAIGGLNTLLNNTTGSNNIAIGGSTMNKNTTGGSNISIGTSAGYSNTTGAYNVAIGSVALYSNTTGGSNTVLGRYSLFGNTTGGSNVALGHEAGRYIGSSGTTVNALTSTSVYIGMDTRALISGSDNENVFGYGAVGLGSNSVVLGNTSVSTTMLNGNVGVTTSTPRSLLHVTGSTVGSTSTLWVGDLTGVKGQICMGDSDGSGATCQYFNNGAVYYFATTTY